MDWNKTIFLAHATEDKAMIRNLYRELKDNGLEPWLDEENLKPGVNWEMEIKEAIKNARFFMACITQRSVSKNGHVQKELRMALDELEKKAPNVIYFIPVLIDDIELPDITVGTIQLKDYHAARLYLKGEQERLINHLKQQVGILDEIKRKENPNFEKLRNEIANGQVETALRLLMETVKGEDIDMYNNMILLSKSYSELKRKNILGLISHEEYSRDNNRIVFSMLELIKILEEKER